MNSDLPSIALEQLLAHRTWVERLARRLVGDESEADDAVQQTWMSAVRAAPGKLERPRAWLGRVLRNAAREQRRSEGRLRSREERAAAPEATASTDEVVARAEIHRRVAEAVMHLEEPYRTTLLLRYFEGLPPREVAARLQCPVETVRSRTQRGLERLRAGFVEDRGAKDWQAWLLPLVRLPARPEGAATGATLTVKGGGMVIAMRWLLFSVLTAGAVTGWTLWTSETAPEDRGAGGLAEMPVVEGGSPSRVSPTPIVTTPLPRAIEPTPVEDRDPRRAGATPSNAGSHPAPTTPPGAQPGQLGLRIDVQPPAPQPGEKVTLTAIFYNPGNTPVEFFVPRFAGSRPFPTWRLEGPGGVVLAPSTAPFQSMWQNGIQGRVVKLQPGAEWRLVNAPTGFVPVDEESGKPRSWAPDLPLRAGRYSVRARYDHAAAAVPFSDRAFEVRQEPRPGLWTGTLLSASLSLERARGQDPIMTIETPIRTSDTHHHRLSFRLDNPGPNPLPLEGFLHISASCKATASGFTEMPMPSGAGGARVLAAGASTHFDVDLDHHTWTTRPYGFPRERRVSRGGLREIFGVGTLALTATLRREEAPKETVLRSNLLFFHLHRGADLTKEGLALRTSVLTLDSGGRPRVEVTLRNDGETSLRIPRPLTRPRHLEVHVRRPDGQAAHAPEVSDKPLADAALRRLLPRIAEGSTEHLVFLRKSRKPAAALTPADFIDLAPGTFITGEIDLAPLIKKPLAAGEFEIEITWYNAESGHRLGMGDRPARCGRVRAKPLRFVVP